jgi:hypothetical protein
VEVATFGKIVTKGFQCSSSVQQITLSTKLHKQEVSRAQNFHTELRYLKRTAARNGILCEILVLTNKISAYRNWKLVTLTCFIYQLNAQFPYSIIIYYIIILNMFRSILCSSSGCQIVLLQHLLSSVSVSGHTVDRLRADSD